MFLGRTEIPAVVLNEQINRTSLRNWEMNLVLEPRMGSNRNTRTDQCWRREKSLLVQRVDVSQEEGEVISGQRKSHLHTAYNMYIKKEKKTFVFLLLWLRFGRKKKLVTSSAFDEIKFKTKTETFQVISECLDFYLVKKKTSVTSKWKFCQRSVTLWRCCMRVFSCSKSWEILSFFKNWSFFRFVPSLLYSSDALSTVRMLLFYSQTFRRFVFFSCIFCFFLWYFLLKHVLSAHLLPGPRRRVTQPPRIFHASNFWYMCDIRYFHDFLAFVILPCVQISEIQFWAV